MATNATTLAQIIGVEKSTKERVLKRLTEEHKALQKPDLFTGFAKTYTPKGDDPTQPTGEQFPPETRNVVANTTDILKKTADDMAALFNVEYAKDLGNTQAKADVVVGDQTILKDVPVTFLLTLKTELDNIHTFVKKLAALDPAEKWTYDPDQAMYSTQPVNTTKTKKVSRPMVMYEATKEHPAQVKEVTEDILTGTWSTIKYSSALPVTRINQLLARVEALQDAVKFAREKANSIEVPAFEKPGAVIFGYLFGE